MKNALFFLLLVLIGATLIMCSGEQKQESKVEEATEETPATTVSDTSMAVCAGGCGMEVEKAKMVTHEVDGEKHYFCSEMCKENYLASKKDEKKEM
jgi:YHS domain-containing protein